MTDRDLADHVERCTLQPGAFGHREHVRLAWWYVRGGSYPEAERRMESAIRRFAAHHGADRKYHHTLTVLWMRLVAHAAAEDPAPDFDTFIRLRPELLDPGTPGRFYSPGRLGSDAARTGWIEPDVAPLPPAGVTPLTP